MSAAYLHRRGPHPRRQGQEGEAEGRPPRRPGRRGHQALLERPGIDPSRIDDVILGCAFPEGEQGMNVARVASLRAGLPVQVPAQTVNRFCASGLQAIATAAERIARRGGRRASSPAGVESMSLVPMGGQKFSANPGLVGAWPESYAGMGITAELVAEKYGDRPRRPGRLRRREPPARRRGPGRPAGSRTSSCRWRSSRVGLVKGKLQRRTERLRRRRGGPPRHHRRGARQAQARLQGWAAPSPPATPRR